MSKAASLLFALVAYAIFFVTFLYLIAFVGNLPLAPVTVDRGPEAPLSLALIINLALIALFGLQHSVMARQGFKRAWKRIVPEPAERSVYVLAASAALIILFVFWRPIEGSVWSVGGAAAYLMWTLFAMGWLIVLLSTFLINHFELFGLQQAWFHVRGRQAAAPQFRQPWFYHFTPASFSLSGPRRR
jgi:methanethiol S-methyltransferase